MKYKIFAVLFFAVPFFLNAQIISGYGAKVGIISSKTAELSGKGYIIDMYQDSRLSGSYSIFAQFLNSEYFRFEAELGYKQEGAEDNIMVTTADKPDGNGQFVTIDHSYDFISLNLSFQPKLENEDICMYGIISPTLNYMLKSRDQILLNDDLTKFVLGYNIGLGFQPKNILNGKLFVEAKFGSSFSKYLKSSYIEAKFNTIQISVGSYIN